MELRQVAEPWFMLGELSHRVCNEYAAAISSVELAAARAKSPEAKAALEETAERLDDYAGVHRALRMPSGSRAELSGHLANLCRALSRSSWALTCAQSGRDCATAGRSRQVIGPSCR
jgi:two-component sensor histidine kinase